MPRRQSLFAFVTLCVAFLIGAAASLAQVNTATLSGQVTDPQGLVVRGAKVTITSLATGAERAVTVDDEGRYTIVGISPGDYKVHVEGGTNLAPFEDPSFTLTVGQKATLNVHLEIGKVSTTVNVSTETSPIETTRSESAATIEQRQINNLPINGRGYLNFSLLNSQTTRDVSPTIGPAPNSGLNFSGARGRSNTVSVDGADFGDNSVDGVRTTLSQEGVQEFQIVLSNYNAEYGRATGGVVNIVTKSGTNAFHGDAFGFLRNSAFQARNPFSGEVDPTTGDLVPIKQAYTRVQAGVAFGGPIKKDKTFYFFSYEYTQREESGFSSIGENNFGLVPYSVPTTEGAVPVQLTQNQANTVTALLGSGNPALETLGVQYGLLMGSASSVATNALDYGAVIPALTSNVVAPVNPVTTPYGTLFREFPLPVTCPVGQTVNSVVCSSFIPYGAAPLPGSYVALNSIRGNYPTSEKDSLYSLRLDHNWNPSNNSFIRVGVSPSYVTGVPSTSQNQVFGQNAGSRTGVDWVHDFSGTFQHTTVFDNNKFNEFRFQYARRSVYFGYSNLPGGSEIGVNIPGYAYFGREPYSTVNRIERRFEWTDNLTWTLGHHTIKFGGDVNLIQLRPSAEQIFELDFGGDVNFGGLPASSFGLPDCINLATGPHNGACSATELTVPGSTGLQSYGLGIPTTYIQGIGSSNVPFNNVPLGFFVQDSWRISPKFTLNYGLRYDVELTPIFQPATAVNAAAEKALSVVEGIPRDYNNIAPRIGFAWDPRGNGKTVVRGSWGLFYDHPLLAIAFNSVTADGGRSVQLISPGGAASACGLVTIECGGGLDATTNLNGSSIFQGVLNALPSMYYEPNQQRFDPLNPNSIFANQNYLTQGFPLPILPFTLPVMKNFQYAYSQQINLTVERQFANTWTVSAGYQGARVLHLYRPIDVNSTDPVLLTSNLQNADAAGLGFTNPLTVAVPNADVAPTATTCGLTVNPALSLVPGVLGVLNNCPTALAGLNGKFVGTPAFFNYFRPSGPNPSYAAAIPGGYGTQVALAQAAGFPTGFGVPVPFNSVDAQQSSGSSWYNALTINVKKTFSKNFEFLSSYTYSHSIDDSTDLQSTLEPQDSRFPQFERSNSVNDQRHRWVTSGVYQTPNASPGASFWNKFLSNFTIAPIIEVSSGRPYNVITGTDTRLDLGASQIRPSVGPASGTGAFGTSSPYIPGYTFGSPTTCLTNSGQPFEIPGITPSGGCVGDLGRNRFTMPMFFQFDLRVGKGINLGERFRLDVIADAFNLFNHTNISAVNQLCDPSAGATCYAGQPSSAYDARIFQFALKLNW